MDADARRDQSGSILTQLTDVENEDDGLLTYDRSRLKVSAARVAAANRRLIAAGTGRINARADYRTGPGVAVAQPSHSLNYRPNRFSNTIPARRSGTGRFDVVASCFEQARAP